MTLYHNKATIPLPWQIKRHLYRLGLVDVRFISYPVLQYRLLEGLNDKQRKTLTTVLAQYQRDLERAFNVNEQASADTAKVKKRCVISRE